MAKGMGAPGTGEGGGAEAGEIPPGWETGRPGGPGPDVPENLEVTVAAAGFLPLPALVARLLALVPGDAVVLEPGPASLRLTSCREWMRSLGALPRDRWTQALAELRRGNLTFVTPDGSLPLLPELMPLEPGDTVVLQLQERGGRYRLFAFKDEPMAEEGAA